MKNAFRLAAAVALLTPLATLGVHSTASAQQNFSCGHWSEGIWVAGRCAPDAPGVGNVAGTIVDIDNNFLTVQVSPQRQVTINDLPALNRGQAGPIYAGRVIIARGYWDNGQFTAVTIG
jgi:hypothetical protein